MFDGNFVFKNAQLNRIVIKSMEFQRRGTDYRYSFGLNHVGAYALCDVSGMTYQPTNVLDMARFKSHILDNEFCKTYIEPSGSLIIKIKKKYRFNPFLVLDGQYLKDWARLFNGLGYTFRSLDQKAVLYRKTKHNPDHNLMAAYVLDAMFQKLIDPDNHVYLEILTRNILHDDIEAFTIKGIAATCLFQVTLKNVMTIIRGMYAKPSQPV